MISSQGEEETASLIFHISDNEKRVAAIWECVELKVVPTLKETSTGTHTGKEGATGKYENTMAEKVYCPTRFVLRTVS